MLKASSQDSNKSEQVPLSQIQQYFQAASPKTDCKRSPHPHPAHNQIGYLSVHNISIELRPPRKGAAATQIAPAQTGEDAGQRAARSQATSISRTQMSHEFNSSGRYYQLKSPNQSFNLRLGATQSFGSSQRKNIIRFFQEQRVKSSLKERDMNNVTLNGQNIMNIGMLRSNFNQKYQSLKPKPKTHNKSFLESIRASGCNNNQSAQSAAQQKCRTEVSQNQDDPPSTQTPEKKFTYARSNLLKANTSNVMMLNNIVDNMQSKELGNNSFAGALGMHKKQQAKDMDEMESERDNSDIQPVADQAQG